MRCDVKWTHNKQRNEMKYEKRENNEMKRRKQATSKHRVLSQSKRTSLWLNSFRLKVPIVYKTHLNAVASIGEAAILFLFVLCFIRCISVIRATTTTTTTATSFDSLYLCTLFRKRKQTCT